MIDVLIDFRKQSAGPAEAAKDFVNQLTRVSRRKQHLEQQKPFLKLQLCEFL